MIIIINKFLKADWLSACVVAGLTTPQEEEKKRKYQQRVLDVEMGSFTRLVFATNGGMGADCNCFLKRLAEKLLEKNEEPYHITITWIRTLLSFEILRSAHTCVRGI